MSYIKWFKDLNKDSIAVAGGKGANLGEMFNLDLPVPPGFCVTAQTFKQFIEQTGLKQKIIELLQGLNVEDTADLQSRATQVQKLIIATPVPEDVAEEIIDNYELLSTPHEQAHDLVESKEMFVAVRSSATAEDLPSISEDEHILITVNGQPVYRKMKEIYGLNPEINDVQIPAMEENEIKWKKVSSIYRHPVKSDKLYKIKTVTGREVTISPDHSLIILDEDNLEPKVAKIADLKGNEKIPAISNLPLINTSEVQVNVLDYVTGNDVVVKNRKVYIINKSSNWSIQNFLPEQIPYTEELAYFLGLYVAEGSTYKTNGIIITNNEREILERVSNYINSIGLKHSKKINKHSLRFYCKTLVRFLHNVAGYPNDIKGKGKLSSVKKVPDFVFGWNKELIGQFLQGAFDGDGGVVNNGIEYCSTSPLLIGGIIKLLEMLNLEFTLREVKKRKEHWHNYQRILIPSREAENFKERIGFHSKRKLRILECLVERHKKKNYHPEFKHTISISKNLAKNIKGSYDKNLPKEEVELAFCPSCDNFIQKSSSYKGRERYYCTPCYSTFYKNQVIFKKEMIYRSFDEKGRFKKGVSPWNRANLQGTFSQKNFCKVMKGLGIKEYGRFFNMGVRWDKIKSVEVVPYTGWVYDFTVPGVQNFAAGVGGIITHNSASFAGQQATYLNIKGKEKLIAAVSACWASLYTARAIYYRVKNNFPHEKVFICIIIQKMVNSAKAGVMFTINPATNNPDELIIEAVYGLGEAIVSGAVNPDLYIVDKKTRDIKKTEVKEQEWGLFRNEEGENEKKQLREQEKKQQVITDMQVKEIARLGKKIEEHYGKPQDIEWAIEEDVIYITQSRPVTTFNKKVSSGVSGESEVSERASGSEATGKIILKGLTASGGVYAGRTKVIREPSELSKIEKGDILVAPMTTPDWVPAMQKAGAIITDEGGMTCHAAIVSREMGIPCIVGTEHATEILKDNQLVTVHASQGVVYDGKVEVKEKPKPVSPIVTGSIVTATEIKVIMDLPDVAEHAAATGADGVGLVRLEIIIANGGIHPAEYIRQQKDQEYIDLLKNGIRKIAQAFSGKKVWVRCSDLRTDEYRGLQGGDQEPKETDPMIGWHAIRRLLDEPKILRAEFQAIRDLHYEGLKNIGVMLPFVINVDEVRQAKQILRDIGMEPVTNIDFGVMIETPASCWIIEDLCKEGISFVSFGTNDLTQLTLGIDRNNQRIAKLFDEMHPAVLGEIAKVIGVCRKYKVKTSICGQAGSRSEMADFLVHQGVDSISANVDAVDEIRKVVARTERKLLLEKERD